jgi:HAD superfamily hydrolase (TIGR01490 family)
VLSLTIFDLDHTLLTVNSSYRFGAYLYKKKFFSLFPLIRCMGYYGCHKLLGLSLEQLHHKVFWHLFKGQPLQEIERHAEAFVHGHLQELIYQPVFERLSLARRQNAFTAILSSSPDFLVKPIAHRLGVDAWYATQYVADGNGLLGRLGKIIQGREKAQEVKRLAQKLQVIDSSITVYSDSYLDLPVLQVAGKAVGVRPDNRLRRLCLKNKWEILE